MTYVRYIDKTREYHRSQGYETYQWAHFDNVAFQRSPNPWQNSRVTLVSTGEVEVKGVDLSRMKTRWATSAAYIRYLRQRPPRSL